MRLPETAASKGNGKEEEAELRSAAKEWTSS